MMTKTLATGAAMAVATLTLLGIIISVMMATTQETIIAVTMVTAQGVETAEGEASLEGTGDMNL